MRVYLFAAAALLVAGVPALADTTSIYEIQSQTGKMDLGSVTIDSTLGTITNIDLSSFNAGATMVSFDGSPTTQAYSPYTGEYIATLTEAGDSLQFNLPVDTLVGYAPTDSAKCKTQSEYCDYLANVYVGAISSADLKDTFEGNLVTPAASSVTPEPSSIALLGTGLLGVAGVIRRRLA